MLASRSLGTDLVYSEKQTLFRFSALYILLSIIIVSAFSFMYYELQRDLMLQEKKSLLQEYAKELIQDLKHLHINFDKSQVYPRNENYTSAIFDSSQKLIFSTSSTKTKLDKILYLEDGVIHLVSIPESYYLGAKYVIVTMLDDRVWFRETIESIIIFAINLFTIMFIIGYFLLHLFLKPMKDAISLLDRFIKDTTHELNTPVSTIVANIEMIDKSLLDEKLLKKINRIDIGAKTISNIYQDLTYITLGNKIISRNEDLDVKQLIIQRIEYFKSLANAKRVTLSLNLVKNTTLFIDKNKFSKLIDNLISNAIKYNKIYGTISISVSEKSIVVEDSGIGIAKENISKLQDRYTRFNKSSGGFGIGLNIVATIAKEFDLKIDISSQIKIGTKVTISW